MPKRASVPEGKALFYHSSDQPGEDSAESEAPQSSSQPTALSANPPAHPRSSDSRDAGHDSRRPTTPVAFTTRPPDPQPADAPATHPPSTPHRSTRQSAIFLEEYHLDWLDDRCREARRNGGRAVRKAAVIRALLDVAMEANINLTTLQSEDDIRPRIRAALRPL